jgi:hypothetical protein
MSTLPLIHDVLDVQLIDRRKEKIGRVDALLLELGDDGPPRVATIVIGGAARAARIGRWMVWLRRATRALFGRGDNPGSRIPFDAVRCIADTIELDVDGHVLESGHVERWLSDRIICLIPGAAGERK